MTVVLLCAINIYSRIVIQLNTYVKIITSSGFKSTILTDFVQGQLGVRFRFGRCLKFSGSCTYLPEVVVFSAGSSTAWLDTKWKNKQLKRGAEFMTSVSYRPEVISRKGHEYMNIPPLPQLTL